MSGGGYRAAAFGLGAVLALIDMGLAGQLAAISSVSGGSITNAFVGAHVLTAADGAEDTLEPLDRASRLLRLLAHRDLVSVRSYLLLIALLANYVAIMNSLASGVLGASTPGLSVAVATTLLVVVATAAYLALRPRAAGRLHEHLLSRAMSSRLTLTMRDGFILFVLGCTMRLRKFRRLAAARFPENKFSLTLSNVGSTYRLIFCSTDLRHGTHVFLSDRFVGGVRPASPDALRADHIDHVGAAPDWPLADAVMASAAFPGVFQPVKARLTDLGLAEPKGAAPARLADGGLHDNLGFTFPKAWYEGRLGKDIADDLGRPPNVFIVVDSGAFPIDEIRRQTPLHVFRRAVAVVHNANSGARREQVKAFLARKEVTGALVSISDNPYRLADGAPEPWRGDLRKALDALGGDDPGITQSWWQSVAQRNPQVRTELKGLDSDTTARLVLHGYANTLAKVAPLLCRPIPTDLPTLVAIGERCGKPEQRWLPQRQTTLKYAVRSTSNTDANTPAATARQCLS